MPRTRSLAWSELKIGILSVVAVVIAALLIFALGGEGGFFWQRYNLKVRFPEAAGVKPGSPVRVAGVEVGSVTAMRFIGAQVEIDFQVRDDMKERIRTTSIATIGSVSLLGEGAVDITARTEGTPVPEWGYVEAAELPATIADVTTQANRGLADFNLMVDELRAGKGTIGRLLTDDAVYRNIAELTTAAASVTRNIDRGRGSLGRLLNDPTAARELEASLTNFNALTQRLSEGEGTLGRLLKDDQLARSLTETTRNFESLSARLSKGEGTAGKLLTDDALYVRLNRLAERFETVATQLSEGQGSAGRLLNDQQLYDNMNQAAGELSTLIGEIRKDPRKFLNVRISIF
jgi:phospholipid/cholesterol/gamma-HCH transport system substrate-binding protein